MKIPTADREALMFAGMMGHQFCVIRTHPEIGRVVAGQADSLKDVRRLLDEIPDSQGPAVYFRAKGSKTWATAIIKSLTM